MGETEIKSRSFTDIDVMNSLPLYDHYILEVDSERVFIKTGSEYCMAELSFHDVEYLSCPTYLGSNFWWRIAPPEEAEHVLERYRTSKGDRERADRECRIYCIDERLEVYHPRPQRASFTYYIVAQSVEIKVYWFGENFERLVLSHFQ